MLGPKDRLLQALAPHVQAVWPEVDVGFHDPGEDAAAAVEQVLAIWCTLLCDVLPPRSTRKEIQQRAQYLNEAMLPPGFDDERIQQEFPGDEAAPIVWAALVRLKATLSPGTPLPEAMFDFLRSD